MKKVRKIIAVLLTVLTLMSVISAATPALATEVTELTENAETISETSETAETETAEIDSETSETAETENVDSENTEEQAEPEVLTEIVEWRTESTKYFRNSDGSYTAAQYAYPVHYKENSEWKEIDNTLIAETVGGTVFKAEKEFVAKNTNTPAKFPDEFKKDGSKKITVSAEGYDISFSPKANQNGIKNSDGKIKDREDLDSVKILEKFNDKKEEKASIFKATKLFEKAEQKNEKFKVENKSGVIAYEDVFDNVDLEYELNNSQIKESIILEEKQDEYVFEFDMDLGGLHPVICEDGSINLCSDEDCEEAVAKIEAPYMVDSNGEYSDAVSMSIEENEDNYILTVTADEVWLNDDERAYPVVIDPTIRLDIDELNTFDCYVNDLEPDKPQPYTGGLYVGNNMWGKSRTLVQFTLPSLPGNNYLITNATVVYYQYEVDATDTSTQYMTIHKLESKWSNKDLNVTWNNQPEFNENVALDYAEVSNSSTHVYEFDVTRTVKEWYEGAANNGFVLKMKNEDVTKRVGLISAEMESVGYYPEIYVTFCDNKGLEDYWSYSSYSIGSAGAAHVNDYTGNLVYELPILSSISERAPVSIVGYYNNYCASKLIGEKDPEAEETEEIPRIGSVRTSIGRGFRLIYQQTVLPSSEYIENSAFNKKYPYVYTDGDGTEHYFVKKTENKKTVYKDEDGIGLTLVTDLNENESGTYKITDKSHNNYYFNKTGNLFRLKDNNGNEINIEYKNANSANDLPEQSRINKIIDGAGHTYTFKYYVKSNGVVLDYVESITDNAGRKINFVISEGLLKKVSYPNGDVVDIVYETHTITKDEKEKETETVNIIDYVQSNNSYRIGFSYTSAEKGLRVRTVTDYGIESNGKETKGQVVSFNRSKYNTTIIRSCGLDGIHNGTNSAYGDDDIITTIQFDNMGRAISQQMEFGSGAEIGAGSVGYTSSSDDSTASGFKNKVSESGASGKYVENLLLGGNAEDYGPWDFAVARSIETGTVDANKSISEASHYIGEKSIKLTINEVKAVGDRCFYKQDFSNVKSGTKYTLSAYAKTGDLVSKFDSSLTGAFIQIRGFDSKGNEIEGVNSRSQILSERSDLDVNNGWRRLSCTVETTEKVAYLRCYLILRNVEGPVCFDGIQLEKGSTANDYNMLENSNFSYASSGVPTSWSGNSQFVFESGENGVVAPEDLSKDLNKYYPYYTDIISKAMRMTGAPGVEKSIYQTVPVEENPKDTYILSGWAKGVPVNTTYHTEQTKGKGTETTDDDEYKGTALFEIGVKVKYDASDGTKPEQEKTSAIFNTTITDWQCASVPISLKYTDGKAGVTYDPTSITIILRYHDQENFVFFDKIMLVKDVASSYTYDKDGNLISASSNSEQKSNMEYENNNLISYTDTAGFKTEFSYEENSNNLNYTTSAKGVYTNYDYDSYGNTTSADVRNKGKIAEATAVIKTTNDYSVEKELDNVTINAGSYKTRSYDANGNTTHYTSDYATGTPTKVKDAKGVETTYEYYQTTNDKNFGKQKSVATGSSKVTYKYNEKEQLDKIIFGTTKTETYSFEYDVFGNVTQTKVGSQSLSTNTFADNNGVLEKTVYGNGDSRRFSYNNFGQKIVDYVTDDGTETKAYSWAYNDSGVNIRHTDYLIGLQYLFDYDSLGRLSKEEVKDYNTGNFVGYTEYGYDVRNNLTHLITKYGGKANNQRYYYSTVTENENSANYRKDNLPTKYKLYSNRYAIYDYDGINRLNQRKFALENTALYYNYIYKLSDRNAENEKVYKTTQVAEEYIGNDVYIYDYDVLGNITSIRKAERKSTDETKADFKEYKNDVDYVTYAYDDLGQLTEAVDYSDELVKEFSEFDYDTLGNITNKYIYTRSKIDKGEVYDIQDVTYNYGADPDSDEDGKAEAGWNNLLTSITTIKYIEGVAQETVTENIDYDAIGNPISYLGAALIWNGRQLTNYVKDNTIVTYTYDSAGLRTSKIVEKYDTFTMNGIKIPYLVEKTETNYYYVNGNLHYQHSVTTDTNDVQLSEDNIYFYYDSNGYLSGIEYNDTTYYPATNLRGDVVAIYNNLGECLGKYEYDAWGNVLTIKNASGNDITDKNHIANINPIRYRGYYYDTETKWYYLQSRYYNPEVGRFLNADGYITTGQGVLSYNMFAYCGNNPIMFSDPSGHIGVLLALGIVYVATAAIIVMAGVAEANNVQNEINRNNIEKEIEGIEKPEDCLEEINNTLSPYSKDEKTVSANKNPKGDVLHIENSNLVTSRYDRQKVSILTIRMSETIRDYDSLSSEWSVHNDVYNVLPSWSSWKTKAEHVDLELNASSDRRMYVSIPSKFYEIMGWD